MTRQPGDPSAPPPPSPAEPTATSPLSEADFAAIRQAVLDRQAVRRACHTARSSAITTFVIGLLAAPFVVLWPSAIGAFAVVGICTIGVLEFLGYRRLQKADPGAARALAINQLAFLGVITLYCVGQMVGGGEAVLSPETQSLLAASPEMKHMADQFAPLIQYGFYGLVIFLSLLFQGGMALYYHTRRRHIVAFNRKTPAWIRRLFLETGV